MEAFGLLNFLKSVFPSLEAPPENPPVSAPSEQPPTTPNEQQKSAPPVENPTSQNAFTAFIEAHEQRVKRIKH